MEIGLHVSNFTFPGGTAALREDLARIAVAAEEQGFAKLSVMDHVWQIHMIGPPEHEMLEAYTTLGYLAGKTERMQLLAWVTAVVYREPGLLAKAVTTLDVLSGGRHGSALAQPGTTKRLVDSVCPSRRVGSGSSGWRRRCRSSCKCGPGGTSRTGERITRWTERSARRSR